MTPQLLNSSFLIQLRNFFVRFSPSIILFIFTFLVDKLVDDLDLRGWYLNFILIFPLVLPFLRFGQSLEYLSTKKSENTGTIFIAQYFVFSLALLIYFFTENNILIIVLFASVGAFIFNFGAKKIRSGNILGFFFQNGIIYLILLSSIFFSNFFFDSIIYFLSIVFIIATYAIFNFRPIFNLNRKMLFFYLNDVAASFLIPLIFFVAFKVSSDLDVDDYLIVKITSLFSAAIGSLILVDFKKMDKLNSAGKKINFFKEKKHKMFYLLILFILSSAVFTFTLYPESILLFFCLSIFEMSIYYFGQFNLLNIYFNLQKNILLTSFICASIIVIIFILSKIFDLSQYSIMVYVLGISCFQFFSFLTFKFNK